MPTPKRIVRYFVSYTRADGKLPDALLKELGKQLGASLDYEFVRWRDTDILVGKDWDAEIKAALDECDIGLLLVSPAFLGNKYITDHELPIFVRSKKPCVPVPLCRIDFEDQDLKGLENAQFFSFTASTDSRSRSFQECKSAAHKAPFAHKLFKDITTRLDDLFADAAPAIQQRDGGIDEEAYRAHIRNCFRILQLEALGGDTIYSDLELQQVFIPPDARDCGEWLPEALEAPAAARLALDELQHQKEFYNTEPRDILRVLNDPSMLRCVVLGAPGAGKSTLARKRLLDWEKEPSAHALPVVIKLRRFDRSGRQDFLDYLENDHDRKFPIAAKALRDRFANGTAELIFDGLDEIPERGPRKDAARQIARYAGQFPGVRMIVTSRLIGYRDEGRNLRDAGFHHWLLADFDDGKIAAFVKKWIADAIQQPADRSFARKRIADALHTPVVRELAGNPLLLTLMAGLARKSDLPRDLASLYGEAADLLFERWDDRRSLTIDVLVCNRSVRIDKNDKRELLRDLAWKMQNGQPGNLIEEAKVREAMNDAFKGRISDPGERRNATDRLIDQLRERNFILCHVGKAQFAFVHRGFLEFFASEHLMNLIETKPDTALGDIGEIYRAHAEDDAWRDVLILAATRFKPAMADQLLAPLIENLIAREVGKEAHQGMPQPLVLVCTVLARAREPHKLAATSAAARKYLEAWIAREPGRNVTADCVLLLANTLPDVSTCTLLTTLAHRDEETNVRSQAVWSLAEYFRDSPETADTLRSIAATELGKRTIQLATQSVRRSADANTYLLSFLEPDGTGKP
ncbi:MAG: NACHT domain-containing protein [Chthoniobacteraceae bacterium]